VPRRCLAAAGAHSLLTYGGAPAADRMTMANDVGRPPTTAERWGAALAYIGMGSLAALLWGRGSFMLRHARLAFSLHLIRLLISGFGLGVWFFLHDGHASLAVDDLLQWFWHLIGLFVLGAPLALFGGAALPLWLAPAAAVWVMDLLGFSLALRGYALPWDYETNAAKAASATTREERERLRRLRDRRLEQIRYATSTAASERQRERQIADSKRDLGANLVRLDHLNHLVAIGELSQARYRDLSNEVMEEIALLREELSALGARVSPQIAHRPTSNAGVADLGSRLQARTLSISFVDRSGLPLFTYGHFPIDEALIAGMLSAFNSLSREVFGSPVNKTQLAEGQVLYFVHGQWCVLTALFDTEPSPSQIGRLQFCLAAFERDNAAELQRDPVHPARLVPTSLDFDTGDAGSQEHEAGGQETEARSEAREARDERRATPTEPAPIVWSRTGGRPATLEPPPAPAGADLRLLRRIGRRTEPPGS
jgi:hypothetical protein